MSESHGVEYDALGQECGTSVGPQTIVQRAHAVSPDDIRE